MSEPDLHSGPTEADFAQGERQAKGWLKRIRHHALEMLSEHDKDALVEAIAYGCQRTRSDYIKAGQGDTDGA